LHLFKIQLGIIEIVIGTFNFNAFSLLKTSKVSGDQGNLSQLN